MTQDEQDRIRAKARVHLEFCKELYQLQMRAGRYFLHEHPRGASSWLEDYMEEITEDPRAMIVEADMCAFGLTSTTGWGEIEAARKATRFVTNSPHVAHAINMRCTNAGV